MAYCATITLHNAQGHNLHTFRYGCMPKSDAGVWCAEIANEAHHLLEHRPNLRVKLLSAELQHR